MDKCMLYVDIGRWRFFKKAQTLKLKIRQARNIIHPRSQATGARCPYENDGTMLRVLRVFDVSS